MGLGGGRMGEGEGGVEGVGVEDADGGSGSVWVGVG